jgi:hypothetical protein
MRMMNLSCSAYHDVYDTRREKMGRFDVSVLDLVKSLSVTVISVVYREYSFSEAKRCFVMVTIGFVKDVANAV